MTDRSTVTSIETYCGKYLDYKNPLPEDIELADIARGLAQTCRFAGQTTRYYSVAEHAIYVARLVATATPRRELQFAALHHDSHEAYLQDWPSPLKEFLGRELFEDLSDEIDWAIGTQFSIIPAHFKSAYAEEADHFALRTEAATLKFSHGTGPHWGFDESFTPLAGIGWSPDKAEREFLKWHDRLKP